MQKKFILELEQGQEVYIPDELSCDQYPNSFGYYDPLIQVINLHFQNSSKSYFQIKTQFNLNKIKNTNLQRQILINLGVLEGEIKKPVHRFSAINQMGVPYLRHTDTHHSVGLQRSRYLLVDTDEDRLRYMADMQVYQMDHAEAFKHSSLLMDQYKTIEEQPLNLRFCHVNEVNEKRQKQILFKQSFYYKQD